MSQTTGHKSHLKPETVAALGRVSPELAWMQIRAEIMGDLQERPVAAKQWCQKYNLAGSLEKLELDMGIWDPVSSLNHLVESNPHLNLRDIPHLPMFTILKAVLEMLLHNQAYN
jgi:hypothetical protein